MNGGREERKRAHSDVRPLSTAVPNASDGPHQRGDQWTRRMYPQMSQWAVRPSSSITRKLVHPLVAQYRRDGCAFAVRRRMRRIALARPTAAFAALRDSMG